MELPVLFKKSFEQEQLELVEAKMKETGPADENYSYYMNLREQYKKSLERKKFRVNGDLIMRGFETAVKACGIVASVGTTVYLAKMAYDEKEEFKVKDGTIWSLMNRLPKM